MHDFIQSLSFQSQGSPSLTRTTLDVLRGVMRSFDDGPAYRPNPKTATPHRRKLRPARNHKS